MNDDAKQRHRRILAMIAESFANETPIPPEALIYFRARLRVQFHALILREFERMRAQDPNFTHASLARRIRRPKRSVVRWMSSPSNLTLDCISDLLLGMGVEIKSITTVSIFDDPDGDGGGIQMAATA